MGIQASVFPDPARAAEAAAAPARLTALWSEFIPYARVEKELPALKAAGVALHQAVSAERPDYDGFVRLYKKAGEAGVRVRPWLVLSDADGYWFNKWNAAKAEAFVEEFLRETERRGLKVDWLVFDLETPRGVIEEVRALIARRDLLGLRRLLVRKSREGSLREAAAAYASLVERLHARGIRVHAVTTCYLLHDVPGDARRLQGALGIPLDGVPWDEVSFMVYRVEFRMAYGDVGPGVVRRYARRAARLYGARAGIDVGEAGKVVYPAPFEGYSDPRDLADDAAAARAEGVRSVHAYSLDGMLDQGLGRWLSPPPVAEPRADLWSRLFLAALDLGVRLLPRG